MGEFAIVVTAALALEERWRGTKREAEAEQAARIAIEPTLKRAEFCAQQSLHNMEVAAGWARQAEQTAKQKSLGKEVKEERAERSDSRDV